MRCNVAATICLGLLLLCRTAAAHRIDEYLQATVISLSADRAHASMRLIPGMRVAPNVIADIDRNTDGVFSRDEQQAYARRVIEDLSLTMNGQNIQPTLLSWSYPSPREIREGVGEIHIEFSAGLPSVGPDRQLVLQNHHRTDASVYLMNALTPDDPSIHILAQKRNAQQSLYELDYRQTAAIPGDAPATLSGRGIALPEIRAWFDAIQFAGLFHLGMQHIAAGTDHLLFLLCLLLPAPLTVAGTHWGAPAAVRQSLRRIVAIVTAFTVGHSITLGLAAFDIIELPSRPVEVLIAVSIFVSALHAWRPIVAASEVWLAGFFGLIHGLSFAATLAKLGLVHWQRAAGILAFNLGIEAMQVLVVAAIMPSLLILSRTRAYRSFRVAGALVAGAASLGWILERSFDVHTPVDCVANACARHAPLMAAALSVMSLIAWRSIGRNTRQQPLN